ncbi:winged helix-turn-helix transcriptional regulator [Priestia endophytica]|uniref:winged helix-turn-helix transcriptional regulator n=1 Tax=Priestia endophytica TaxID=135735 RepID=UPI002E2102F0|nr:helix-turn-helix domain-containing protein [Priestia endophytica]
MSGKWKMLIIFHLGYKKVMRYGELKRAINGITHKMLSKQLKELEKEQLIIRQEYSQIPPKVEYFLSNKGVSLLPITEAMCNWGKKHK